MTLVSNCSKWWALKSGPWVSPFCCVDERRQTSGEWRASTSTAWAGDVRALASARQPAAWVAYGTAPSTPCPRANIVKSMAGESVRLVRRSLKPAQGKNPAVRRRSGRFKTSGDRRQAAPRSAPAKIQAEPSPAEAMTFTQGSAPRRQPRA
jgi:hypothetical protein